MRKTMTPKQAAFLLTNDFREVFYGGSARGGKSQALLMAALQYVDVPGYSAIIFRRTFSDLALPGALIDTSHEILSGTDAKWHSDTKRWTFPSGATLAFGYLDTDRDRYRYQGAEFQFVGFDELSHFTERQYLYLFSRLTRLEGSCVPIRMRATSNPGGDGHEWVKRRFISHRTPGRIFIPAGLRDNPFVDQDEYIASLSNLDPVTRRQLLDGDWDVTYDGELFKRHWFPIVECAPSAVKCVRYWDLAATEKKSGNDPDWTVGIKMSRNDAGNFFVHDEVRLRGTPQTVQETIRQTAMIDGVSCSIGMEQEPGSSGVNTIDHYRRNVLHGFDFKGIRSTGDKLSRLRPVSAQAEAGNVKLVNGPWVNDFLSEICSLPNAPHDDRGDAMSGAFGMLVFGNTGDGIMDFMRAQLAEMIHA